MKARLVKETVEFKRTGDTKRSLDVGEKRDQIPWDRLDLLEKGRPYKVLAKDPDDEAFIYLGQSGRFYIIKKWEANGGEWLEGWTTLNNIINLSLEEWLKENNAYKLIPYRIKKYDKINLGGLEKVEENQEFRKLGMINGKI